MKAKNLLIFNLKYQLFKKLDQHYTKKTAKKHHNHVHIYEVRSMYYERLYFSVWFICCQANLVKKGENAHFIVQQLS